MLSSTIKAKLREMLAETPEEKAAAERDLPGSIIEEITDVIGRENYYICADMIVRVHRIARYYPASAGRHNAEAGGLWRHSLTVALNAYQLLRKYEPEIQVVNPNTGNLSAPDAGYLQRQYRLMSFIVGLLHDIGKIMDYRPVIKNQPSQVQINPLDLDAVASMLERFEGRVVLTKKAYRTDMRHAFFSAYYFPTLLPSAVLKGYDPEVIADAIEAVATEHIETGRAGQNILLRVLKAADSEAVVAVRAEAAVKKSNEYIEIIRNMLLAGKTPFPVNDPANFSALVDIDNNELALNPNIGIDIPKNSLKIDKPELIMSLKQQELFAVELDCKNMVQVRIDKKQAFPCIVLKLSAFGFPAEFLNDLKPCPEHEYFVMDKKDKKSSAKQTNPEQSQGQEHSHDHESAVRDADIVAQSHMMER